MKRLSDYYEFFDHLHRSIIDRMSFQSNPPLEEVLKNPRTIVVMNHSTPLSWIPAVTTLGVNFMKAGGGQRIPRGVMDRWFYRNPLTRAIATYVTQSAAPESFEELLRKFREAERTDLVIFPEGANTFFGDVSELQDFRSPRFVELAIRAEAPILIAVHRGSESWSLPVTVPRQWAQWVLPFSRFFAQKISQFQSVNLPKLPKKIDTFNMVCELYHPKIKPNELSSNLEIRTQQIHEEAVQIREQMRTLLGRVPYPGSMAAAPRSEGKSANYLHS